MKRLIRPNCPLLVVSLFVTFWIAISISYAQAEYISPEEARSYIGKVKTVCGTVASTKYAIRSRGKPTFLNLNRPYPNHVFTVVIWGSDRDKFESPPETYYENRSVCVTGRITAYRGKPQIVVHDLHQITIR